MSLNQGQQFWHERQKQKKHEIDVDLYDLQQMEYRSQAENALRPEAIEPCHKRVPVFHIENEKKPAANARSDGGLFGS